MYKHIIYIPTYPRYEKTALGCLTPITLDLYVKWIQSPEKGKRVWGENKLDDYNE